MKNLIHNKFVSLFKENVVEVHKDKRSNTEAEYLLYTHPIVTT